MTKKNSAKAAPLTLLFWPMTTMMTLLRATPAKTKQQQHHDACSKLSPTHGQPPPWWCHLQYPPTR
eukprot:scaffold23040_cov73-Skeletonema_dohrnii-CCMP3373.AAC.3